MNNKNLILAVDTAISHGSFSLWENEFEINFYIGEENVSRSEDILEVIDKLLRDVNFEKTDISRVLFTNGPGSYTGLRVGVSTVLGLCYALNCPFQNYSILEVLTTIATKVDAQHIISVVQAGREDIIYQEFNWDSTQINPTSNFQKQKLKDFNEEQKNREADIIIVEKNLESRVLVVNPKRTVFASDNVATLLHKYYQKNNLSKIENSFILNYGEKY